LRATWTGLGRLMIGCGAIAVMAAPPPDRSDCRVGLWLA
jgi:hypothetical protein